MSFLKADMIEKEVKTMVKLELEKLKSKISEGMKRHYATEKGEQHRRRLREWQKKKWAALKAKGECPRCGSNAELLESFYPKLGGRFRCRKCMHEWSEG
jgi:hypothetical protein